MDTQNKNDLSAIEIIDGFPEPQRSQTMAGLTELLMLKLTDRLQSLLSEAQLSEMEDKAKTASREEMEAWFHQAVPNYEQIREEVTEETNREIVAKLLGKSDQA